MIEVDARGRLLPADVVRLEQVLGGDPVTEAMVLRFTGDRWGAESLFELPARVAEEIIRRPADFLRAAKNHCEAVEPF